MASFGATACLLLGPHAAAVDYAEEFTRKIQAAKAVAPLGSDLFGDQTDWYNGTTTFRVVDVDIPGNDGLPVRIARTLSTAPPEGPTAPGLMGQWELELPHMSGVFPQGNAWRIGPSLTINRCSSGPLTPPPVPYTGGAFAPEEYWRGYFVSIPGQGSTHMLWRDPAYTEQPSDGYSYPWVTVGHTQLRCGITLANGTGEGFWAVAADGTRYRFETKRGTEPVQKYVYSYSNAGDLTLLDDQVDGADDATLTYDNLHRLATATGLWGSYTYAYDPLNNIRSRTGPSVLTYSYDGSTNRLSGITGAQTRTYAYNAKGEITGDGIKTFTVNADGQIASITGIASYAYDGNGKRIRVTPQSGSAEYALYTLGGDLVYSEKGTEQTDYLKLGGQTLVKLKKTGGVTTATYLHPDLLGSPRKATTAAAAILWQEHFDPYGAKLNGVVEKIGYSGHAHDAGSGYTYMQARFYDPLVGRFLSTDPIHFQDGDPFTFNRYAYANNNPYKFVDPDGRAADLILDIGFIGYSLYALTTQPSWTNAAALGGDVFGAAVPFLTGVGTGIRAAAHAEDAVDAVRGVSSAGEAARAGAQTFGSFSALKNVLGPAGPGKHWHHIVEQTPGNLSRFGAQSIHNTQNVLRLDAGVHQKISAYYSSKDFFTGGQPVRQWLSGQSLEQQVQFGLDTLRRFGVSP